MAPKRAHVKTPDWVKDAVFYQIFPDRFARSQRVQHPPGLQFKAWGTPPEEQGFQGGDLLGIVDKLDYLHDLGITALYLNPVFAAAANHRYHTFDYFQVDPLLGGNRALRELLDAAHARGMRIVLDGVFNHGSRGFWAFHHILENGGNSPYIDWFIVRDWPLRPYDPDGRPSNYEAWWGIPALPKFNFDNEGVREYFLEVARYWIEFGIDGWRLDVPEEISHPTFWQDFRTVVKAANPDAYIVGEIWHEAEDWLQGDRFDAVMNYVFNRAAFGLFGKETLRTNYDPGGFELQPLTVQQFARRIEHMVTLHDWEIVQAQLNLLDSHDTARVPWIVQGDESAQRLCILFQMTMPGTPCIYYGDEVGLDGANDPHCREAFPWHDEASWDRELLQFYRDVIRLRQAHPVLRRGDYVTLHASEHVYGFGRCLGGERAIVLFNVAAEAVTLCLGAAAPIDVDPEASTPEFDAAGFLEEGAAYRVAWPAPDAAENARTYTVQSGTLEELVLPGRSALVLLHGALKE